MQFGVVGRLGPRMRQVDGSWPRHWCIGWGSTSPRGRGGFEETLGGGFSSMGLNGVFEFIHNRNVFDWCDSISTRTIYHWNRYFMQFFKQDDIDIGIYEKSAKI